MSVTVICFACFSDAIDAGIAVNDGRLNHLLDGRYALLADDESVATQSDLNAAGAATGLPHSFIEW